MTNPTPLSPAARAVLDAVKEISPAPADEIAAAALRAAADQVVPEDKVCDFSPGAPQAYELQRRVTRHQLLAIAAELEGAND